MTHTLSTPARARRHLFLGSAAGALACVLAGLPAQAQTVGVRATAARSLVNDQASQGIDILSDTSNAQLNTVVAGTTDASTVTLSSNDVGATARGNQAVQVFAPDMQDVAGGFGPTMLTAGGTGVTANAATLIASRQRNKGSEIVADNMDAATGIDAGEVSKSHVAVTNDTQEAVALGNNATATLATNGGIDAGAGIVSLQTGDANANIAALSISATGLSTRDVSASDLAVTGNLERGIAYGNALDNALSAKPSAIEAPATGEIASIVPALEEGGPVTNAAYAILSNQSGAGTVKARAGSVDGFASGLVATGNVDGSLLMNDRNALVAAGYGNSSANSLDLDTVSIAYPMPDATEAVANVTSVQGLADTARIIATTLPGTVTHIFGDASNSGLSLTDNGDQTIATGNLASGNLLAVKANTIDTRHGDQLGDDIVGTALTTPAGDASINAAFSVQNVQDYGKASILAGSTGNAAGIEVGGTVSGSTLHDDGNASLAAATGNGAANTATLDATTIATSAGVNNLQTGDGDVTVSMGSSDHRAGATISPLGSVSGSTISVTKNKATGTATANTSSNSLTVNADTLLGGSGRSDAEAGPIGDGYGAAATFTLANEQKAGEPSNDGSSTPTITANVLGRFAVTGDGGADQSSLAVEDNSQNASALANDTVNRLSISATGHGDGSTPDAGAALSSSQYGEANVSATSDAKFAARGAISNSTVSLSGNSNAAVATINQADNGVSVDGVQIGSVTGNDTSLSTGPLGPPFAAGDRVLANQQFAIGSVTATAYTRFIDGDAGGGLDASQFTIAGNVTGADAAANRALNSVSVAGTTGGLGNAGLVNTQVNAGSVTASATTDAAFIVAGAPLAPTMGNSVVSITGNQTGALARGNTADNQLALGGNADLADTTASTAIQPFDATVRAASTLLNSQASYGAVTATAADTGYGIPLNGTGAINASMLDITGNNVSAAAYGNVASNSVTVTSLGRLPSAAIVNVQANYGPVTAQVTGASYRVTSGPLSAATLSITGNQIAAMAVGNQASSTIASKR